MADNSSTIGAINVTSSEVKCPGCGGTIGIKFDPNTLTLKCPFCGLSTDLPQPGTVPVNQKLDFDSALQRANVSWDNVKKLIICSNCGGQTLYDAEQITGGCPFCGSTSVMPAAENPQIMAPQAVIPFAFDKELAQKCFTHFLGKKHFLCKGVTDSKLEDVVGVYLPFWTFSALTVSGYKAKYVDGTSVNCIWNEHIDDHVIYASDKFRHPMIDRVRNFEYNEMLPYSPQYLAGIPAERYTVGLDEAWERSKTQMKDRIRNTLWRKSSGKAAAEDLKTDFYNVKFRYILAPVYLATYRYKKTKRPVAINGQTGETYCDAPTYLPVLLVIAGILLLAWLIAFFISFTFGFNITIG